MTDSMLRRRSLLAGAGALAAGRRSRAAAAAVRVGVLTDENGPYADSGGKGSILAARMAAADFGGTVLGAPIEIVHADTQNKPDVASGVARAWFDSGVDAVVDLPVTSVAAAVQQVAREKLRTVMICAAASTDFTAKTCAPVSSHWADDTHAISAGAAEGVVRSGGKDWFFVTVDYAFGAVLQREATAVIEANGGRVVGSAKFPLGASDYASVLLAAQASGAQIVGLAAVGADLVNLIKQAGEFGLEADGHTLVGFLIYITDIHALGLAAAQGFTFVSSYYWDQNDVSRAWAKRFMAVQGAMPTRAQALVYTSILHFLKAMAQVGSREAVPIGAAMRAAKVEYQGRPAVVRADGRMLSDLTVYRVKAPGQSAYPWDYYTPVGVIAADHAFLAGTPACMGP